MKIAPATPDHAAALALILGDWLRETPWMPVRHSREEDCGFLSHLIDTAQVFVADQDRPTGFICVDGDTVPALYVAAHARGRGVGTALLRHACSGRDHLRLWCFQANTGGLRFYARHGFREIARSDGKNEEGLPDVQLLWQRDRA